MAEYIEKEVLYKKVAELEELARNRYLDTPSNSPACARYMAQLDERTRFKHLIADFPAVDVAPVVHGRWEHDEMYEDWADQYLCSVCKCHALTNGDYMHKLSVYCPSCGAKMDLDTANDVQSIYKSALNKWGKENQTRMMFEEMAELQKELCKEARGEDNKDAIAEEIADVKIMLAQMMILHNCKDMVEMQMKRKLQRLKERLEGE